MFERDVPSMPSINCEFDVTLFVTPYTRTRTTIVVYRNKLRDAIGAFSNGNFKLQTFDQRIFPLHLVERPAEDEAA